MYDWALLLVVVILIVLSITVRLRPRGVKLFGRSVAKKGGLRWIPDSK